MFECGNIGLSELTLKFNKTKYHDYAIINLYKGL